MKKILSLSTLLIFSLGMYASSEDHTSKTEPQKTVIINKQDIKPNSTEIDPEW